MKYFVLNKRQLLTAVFVFITAIGLAIFAMTNVPDSVIASGQARKIPIYNVENKEHCVSLSFDAAWGNEDTQTLIDILGQENIKATFFVVGEWVDKYPESVKALSDAGHEIMNHSDTHPDMVKLSKNDMIKEINSCNDKIEAVTGKRPTLFRAPYGSYNNTLIEVLDSLGMHCIQWNVDSLDWKDPPVKQLAENVLKRADSGSIMLFHNAAKNTPAALPEIINGLKENGFSFKPISELIYTDNYFIDYAGCQHRQSDESAMNEVKKSAELGTALSETSPANTHPYYGDYYLDAAMQKAEAKEKASA